MQKAHISLVLTLELFILTNQGLKNDDVKFGNRNDVDMYDYCMKSNQPKQ